jgi:hypothetical protein
MLIDVFIRVAQYVISIYLICVYIHDNMIDRIISAVILTRTSVAAHHQYR